MSEYYTKNELYGEKFYQIPKVLFTNPLYKKGLKDREKIAFGLLKDRFSLSKKNGWFDKEGRIYFIFSQENLMDIFDCSKQTASNIKKALTNVGLLEVKKWGQGRADWLYLKKPLVTDDDIYLIDKEENGENLEAQTVGAVRTSKNETSKGLENRRQEVQNIDGSNTDFKETEKNNTELNIVNNYRAFTKNELLNHANSFYDKMAPTRWNKKEWLTIVTKLIDEKEELEFQNFVNYPLGYIEGCLKEICKKHDIKRGKIETEYQEALKNSPIPDFDYYK